MTEFKIYYPTGLISEVSYPLNLNIVKPLSTVEVLATTTGVYDVTQVIPQNKGTIEVLLTTGAQGSSRSLAFLVDTWPNPTKFVGITLDSNNRPFAYLSIDGAGGVFAQSIPEGSGYQVGVQLKVRLSFNLTKPVHDAWTALLQVGEDGQGNWVVEPGVTTTIFQPKFLVVGAGGPSGDLDFNGSLSWAQASGNADVIVTKVPVEEATRVTLSGSSSISANLIYLLNLSFGGTMQLTSQVGFELPFAEYTKAERY